VWCPQSRIRSLRDRIRTGLFAGMFRPDGLNLRKTTGAPVDPLLRLLSTVGACLSLQVAWIPCPERASIHRPLARRRKTWTPGPVLRHPKTDAI
ncbi:unnamed protein product, partial [Mycena citricolor]